MHAGRVLLLAGALAWPLQPLDDAVREWTRSHQQPGVRSAMQVVSKRSGLVLISGTVVGLFLGPVGRACVAEVALALAPVNLAVEGLKWTVNRSRPNGDTNRKNSSFPSSHAANAFTVAAVLSGRFRRAIVPLWLLAATVAFSRVYLDRHWLSDVAGSALLAWGGAWFSAWVVSRWRARKVAAATG
jgi:membrane-associated phospholipid phosphatase